MWVIGVALASVGDGDTVLLEDRGYVVQDEAYRANGASGIARRARSITDIWPACTPSKLPIAAVAPLAVGSME